MKPAFGADGIELIAEIGQAHEGSLGLLHSYVDAAAEAGATAVKFQMHIAEAESSALEPFRVAFSYEDASRYDYWKRMEFTPEQWGGVHEHCERRGVEFLVSPFSLAAVELLERLGVRRYKIGSGEIANLLMLERIAATGKPVILSSGLSGYQELDRAVELLRGRGCPFAVLQCTTRYPTAAEDLGLNVIAELRRRYAAPAGLSDHSGKIYAGLAAAALGAELVEVHAVFDRRMFGPDAGSSLTIAEIATLAEGLRYIHTALRHPADKAAAAADPALRAMFGKTLAVNRGLAQGEALSMEVLESKKPAGQGIAAAEFRRVLGRCLRRPLQQWDFLRDEDLE